MKLSEKDAELYYELMWALQFYVNRKLKIHPDVKSVDEYEDCGFEEKFEVRNALFENPTLIDQFVEENPQGFSDEKLSIVSGWKNFVKGEFQIERYLKRCAILISGDDVYGVLGINHGFEEMIPKSRLPFFMLTVLLPFKGKIIFDGFSQAYNVFFGGGVKSGLKETYMTAKQNDRIIESLEAPAPEKQKEAAKKPVKDFTPVLDELAETAKALKGSASYPAMYSPAFSMIKATIDFGRLAVDDSSTQDDFYDGLRKVQRAFRKALKAADRHEDG